MSTALGSDADPTYTHFEHRDEFLKLLDELLELDMRTNPTLKEEEDEVKLVDQMGAIVSDSHACSPSLVIADACVARLLSAIARTTGSLVIRNRQPLDGHLDDGSFHPSK
jgi:hypothetical protein